MSDETMPLTSRLHVIFRKEQDRAIFTECEEPLRDEEQGGAVARPTAPRKSALATKPPDLARD